MLKRLPGVFFGAILRFLTFTEQTQTSMTYELISERVENKRPTRTYKNKQTGGETKLYLIYEDKDNPAKGRWWGFTDLYKIPIMRMVMARNITDLYNVGLSLKDIQDWCSQEKTLLRGNDPEKYEKLYQLVLEKEKLATFTADPIKQQIALATVYVLKDDERIDYFDEQASYEKLQSWKPFPELSAFFLHWLNRATQPYIDRFSKISTTALKADQQRVNEWNNLLEQFKPLKGSE